MRVPGPYKDLNSALRQRSFVFSLEPIQAYAGKVTSRRFLPVNHIRYVYI
jgi:hypothetical protein